MIMKTTSGTVVRFYREPKRNGGHLIAVLSTVDRNGHQECFTSDGYQHDVDQQYIRNLKRATSKDIFLIRKIMERLERDEV